MRVVLDTNVLVSAALKQKSMPRMAALVVERRGGLLKSLATEQQLFEVLARPYFDSLSDPDARAWLKKLLIAPGADSNPRRFADRRRIPSLHIQQSSRQPALQSQRL
jgi:hypothetical protein